MSAEKQTTAPADAFDGFSDAEVTRRLNLFVKFCGEAWAPSERKWWQRRVDECQAELRRRKVCS